MLSRLLRIAALSCLPGVVSAQAKFEGVVTARLASLAGRGGVATYSVKGERLRMDMTGATGVTSTFLHDPRQSLDVILMHQQKMVLDVSATQGAAAASAAAKKPKVKMTGKKETIAGRECEHVIVTSDDGTRMDVCLAKGMGAFVMGGAMGGRGRSGEASPEVLSRLGADAFPLKVTDLKRGATIFQVTKIENKSLDEGLFKIPDGYQKLDMGRVGRPDL